ncbi:Sporulation and spore germination [Desulfuromusa kysingii]|uniref:Sporulation and spore germination n=2 Tax=Desulfuromusa kysingii TaxID=37625 RepID=A0A1H3VRL4_9BACT|nr:Sporulation and spore germination [Desulfuromusa kysingii]
MKKMLLNLLGILLFGVLIGYGASWFFQQGQMQEESTRVVITRDVPVREIQLYFVAPTGTFLVPESFDILACDDDVDCLRELVNGLISGSSQQNLPVLPKETKVLAVDLENDLVRINFSRQLVDFHPGGSLTELLSIYSLANSLNENFPYIRQLQILVEGEVLQTLKGHARIDQPIYADYRFSKPPLSGPPPESPQQPGESQDLSIEQLIQDNESSATY